MCRSSQWHPWKKHYHTVALFLSLLCVGPLIQADTGSPLVRLHYNERPPYHFKSRIGVGGLTGTPAAAAFHAAGIPFEWINTPAMRQLFIIKRNQGLDCLVGWFKNEARETYGKFTLPIYQDASYIALMNRHKVAAELTLTSLLSNKELILLVKDAYSYGEFLDEQIRRFNPTVNSTVFESVNMLKAIAKGNADYMFIAPEEAESAMIMYGLAAEDYVGVHFKEMPPGENRYIFCSEKVSDDIIERLNAAILQNR